MNAGKVFRFTAAVAVMLALVAALAAPAIAQDTSSDAPSFPVSITFVNAMTSLDKVDVYVNGDREEQRVIEGFEYGAVSESFEGTAPGTIVVVKYNVDFGFDRYLYSTLIPTAAGQNYLVVISDLFLIPTLFDARSAEADAAYTQAIHAAAQAPAVDVYVAAGGDDTTADRGEPTVTGLSFGLRTDGVQAPAGSYAVVLTATGTDTVVIEQTDVQLEAGTTSIFVLIGKPGSTEQPLTLLQVQSPAAD